MLSRWCTAVGREVRTQRKIRKFDVGVSAAVFRHRRHRRDGDRVDFTCFGLRGTGHRPALRTQLDQPGRQAAARVVRSGEVRRVHTLGSVLGAGVRQRMVLDELVG